MEDEIYKKKVKSYFPQGEVLKHIYFFRKINSYLNDYLRQMSNVNVLALFLRASFVWMEIKNIRKKLNLKIVPIIQKIG